MRSLLGLERRDMEIKWKKAKEGSCFIDDLPLKSLFPNLVAPHMAPRHRLALLWLWPVPSTALMNTQKAGPSCLQLSPGDYITGSNPCFLQKRKYGQRQIGLWESCFSAQIREAAGILFILSRDSELLTNKPTLGLTTAWLTRVTNEKEPFAAGFQLHKGEQLYPFLVTFSSLSHITRRNSVLFQWQATRGFVSFSSTKTTVISQAKDKTVK